MQQIPAWFRELVTSAGGYCGTVGTPYPCTPFMDPSNPDRVYGCGIPCDKLKCEYEEAVKRLCWVETTIRSVAPVAAGADITFTIEVKWWFQVQAILNVGDQANATFDLVDIRYGQSNYNLEMLNYEINGVGVPPNGIDVRRWNFEVYDRFYPLPACGLNDPIELTFTNVTANAQDLELVMGGPAVLQIG